MFSLLLSMMPIHAGKEALHKGSMQQQLTCDGMGEGGGCV